ncbi:MAG: serine/threonine-protein kinase [Vicinamibacterales bacterium]
MPDQDPVEQLFARVADRQPVDWDAVLPDLLESDSASPDDLEALALLRLLDEVGAANAALQQGELADSATTSRPAVPAVAPEPDDDTLTSWGRYTLEAKVGRGGFGSVYRAWDPVLEMPVAIKILHRRYSEERLAGQLVREGRALAQVTHPHVVRVLNVAEHEGRVGLVMEYLRGQTLDDIIATGGRLNHREATVIVEDVCRALAAVHDARLVHRDVKARNIMREHDGRLVLMDFGAGVSQHEGADDVDRLGTPLYMPPEVMRGAPATMATDVYGVGVLLFHLVTRRYPFEGKTIDDLRLAQARGEQVRLLAVRPDLPLPFVKVVERAVAVDPAERFATSGALLQALLDARSTPWNWRGVAVRAAAAMMGVAAFMTVGGAISSGVFNASLGRQAYATESFVDWFVLGRRSLVLPLVLSLLGVGAIGVIAALRELATGVWPAARRADAALSRSWRAGSSVLKLEDPVLSSCWLVLATTAGLVGAWIYWSPLLTVVTSDLAAVPADRLVVLSDAQVQYRTYFRMALSLLMAANVTGWDGLVRFAASRHMRLPAWLPATQGVLLALVFVSMQVPYRLVHDNDEFRMVSFGTERCHVLGERRQDLLLFCPASHPRQLVVSSQDPRLVPSNVRESLFATFAPQARPAGQR